MADLLSTKYYTKAETAVMLRISVSTVDLWIRRGRLLATKFGGKVLIDIDQIESLINKPVACGKPL